MSIPWYDPALYGWIPGTLLGVTAGLLSGIIGVRSQASSEKLRRSALKLALAMMAVSGMLLLAGLAAFVGNQPYGVWYGLLLPGLLGLALLAANLPMLIGRMRKSPFDS